MSRLLLSRTRVRAQAAVERQAGIVLLVVLVMLVVIGLTSVAVMRSALSADLVSNNERQQALATQAAHIGLRYCEAELVKDGTVQAITVHPAPVVPAVAKWKAFENWHTGTAKAVVPVEFLASDKSSFTPATRPQCMAESRTLPSGDAVVIVTARGFSPDYQADEAGRTLAGSVVWLQSIVQLVGTPAAP